MRDIGKKKRKSRGNGKYHDWITKEGLLKIEGWARDGLTDEQIAHNIGIAVSTLNNWKNRHAEFLEALKRGKEVIDRQVENALLKRALGYEYEEEKTYIQEVNGVITKRKEITVKQVVPDTTAQIFWLKNRKPAEWRDRPGGLNEKEQKARIEKLEAQTKALKGISEEFEDLSGIIGEIYNETEKDD